MSEKDKKQASELAVLLEENPGAERHVDAYIQGWVDRGRELAKADAQAPEDGKEGEPA